MMGYRTDSHTIIFCDELLSGKGGTAIAHPMACYSHGGAFLFFRSRIFHMGVGLASRVFYKHWHNYGNYPSFLLRPLKDFACAIAACIRCGNVYSSFAQPLLGRACICRFFP